MRKFAEGHNLMKSKVRENDNYKLEADIAKGIPQPELQKLVSHNPKIVDLPEITLENAPKADYFECTYRRISRRNYTEEEMKLYDLSYMLYCTQGVKKVIGGYKRYIKDGSGKNYLRLVANSGYAYDTYLAVNNVEGLENGIWHYLPLKHQLEFVGERENLPEKINNTFTNPGQDQSYTMKANAIFF